MPDLQLAEQPDFDRFMRCLTGHPTSPGTITRIPTLVPTGAPTVGRQPRLCNAEVLVGPSPRQPRNRRTTMRNLIKTTSPHPRPRPRRHRPGVRPIRPRRRLGRRDHRQEARPQEGRPAPPRAPDVPGHARRAAGLVQRPGRLLGRREALVRRPPPRGDVQVGGRGSEGHRPQVARSNKGDDHDHDDNRREQAERVHGPGGGRHRRGDERGAGADRRRARPLQGDGRGRADHARRARASAPRPPSATCASG